MRTLVLICVALVVVEATSGVLRNAQRSAARVENDSACLEIGGKCQNTGLACGGGYVSGKCPGNSSNKCCVGKVGVGENCGYKGKCIDVTATQCPYGKTNIGLCNGPAEVQCCQQSRTHPQQPSNAGGGGGGGASPAVPATTSMAGFQKLWSQYPNGEADDVKRRIGGNINADYITNTCVIRVSRAMWLSGMKITPFSLSNGKNGLLVSGQDGRAYPIRVKEFNEYMHQRYGPPTLHYGVNGDSMDIPDSFRGKTGIIMFDVRVWSDASGHFDLWNGYECKHECYFNKARNVYLWPVN